MASIRYSARNLSADDVDFEITVWEDATKNGSTRQKLMEKEVGAGKSKSKNVDLDSTPKKYAEIEVAGLDVEIDTDPDNILRVSVIYTADEAVEVTITDADGKILGAHP